MATAILTLHAHAFVPEVESAHLAVRAQLEHVRARLARVEQAAVDVGAVRHRVRIAVALAEASVERNVDHRFAADAVHHQQPLDEHRFLLDPLAHAERVERGPRVGRKLDARADLAEFLRLLEHQRAETLDRERQRAGQSADATAGDDDRFRVTRRAHAGNR
jgi:hypothetical protein